MDSQSSSTPGSTPRTKRTRKRAEKSRLGCAKCKSRRIRCDEKRPGCENCAKLRFPCPGYQQQLRWSNKHQPAETLNRQETSHPRVGQPGDASAIGQITQAGETNTRPGSTVLDNVSDSSKDVPDPLGGYGDLNWLTELSSTWPATDFDIGGYHEHVDEDLWNSFSDLTQPIMPDLRPEPSFVPTTSIVQAPVHLSTTLIEYWFRHICPVRSTFDSDINNNRTLAQSSWDKSEALFYTMQVMSAVCLVDSMPQLGETLPSLRQQATLAITQGITQVRNLRVSRVTIDLVFAVVSMGTSSHWVLPGNSDHTWLESARELLSIWSVGISAADALIHEYFCQALAYWEMLLTVVGRGSKSPNIEKRRQKYHGRLRRAMRLEANDPDATEDEQQPLVSNIKPLGTRPNSWCGISNEVIEIFGQVLALCRSACEYNQDNGSLTLDTTSKALCDIAVAHELERELLSMDFDGIVLLEEVQGFYVVETRDDNTPVSHLLQTAEAYRKAGLLQLYLTFDDLDVSMSSARHGSSTTDAAPSEATAKEARARSVVNLALQLVATLEKIPPESGSKFIHPMLYLSAAVGLKFDRGSGDSFGPELPEDINRGPKEPSVSQADRVFLDPTAPTMWAPDSSDTLTAFIPQSILKIAEARRLVWSRLGMIRQAIPYKTSDSLLRLVKNMWSEYDKAQSNTSKMSWVKILSQTGLEMLL